MANTCPKCGAQMQAGHCPNCHPPICPYCKREIDVDDLVCPHCGKPLTGNV